MEQVHCFGGWEDGAKSLWCPDFADRQTYKTSGAICIKCTKPDRQAEGNTNVMFVVASTVPKGWKLAGSESIWIECQVY